MPRDESSMTDDCADLRFRLMLFRRGELDAAEAEAVRAHLAGCPDCTAELEAERELDRRLAGAAAEWTAPPELEQAVRAELDRAREPRRRRWARAMGRTVRRPLVAAGLGAAAALLVVSAGGLIAARGRPQPDPLAGPMAEAASIYRRELLEYQLGRTGPADVARALAELQQRLDVPTTTAFRGDDDLALVRVDPAETLGRPGATLVFRSREGLLVTLQIVRAPEFQVPRERGTLVAGRFRPVITRQKDLSMALWKQGNAFYALSAPVDEKAMADIYLKVRLGTSNP
jgi:anti-sigma factor (TIGR02949 family)